jgi:hypothetical protein
MLKTVLIRTTLAQTRISSKFLSEQWEKRVY